MELYEESISFHLEVYFLFFFSPTDSLRGVGWRVQRRRQIASMSLLFEGEEAGDPADTKDL